MKKHLLFLLLLGLICAYCGDAKTYIPELCRQCDVIDYPEIPGYGSLRFKVFQPQSDWKCELKDGRLILTALKKVVLEKQWDNDQLRQKMSFSFSNTSESHIMLTVYVKGAKTRNNIIREKLTGSGCWSKEFTTPHLIKNPVKNTPDFIEEYCTADKITLRLFLTPGAKIDITSASFQVIADELNEKNTPFSTACGKRIVAVKLPENPDYWQLFAATRLRKYLYLQTGKMLPFAVGKTPSDNMINIGFADSSFAGMKEKNAFRVSSGRSINISADRSANLVYGSYELLERCGFRFYGRFHQVIPDKKSVVFPVFECKRATSFTYCSFNMYGDMIGMGYRNKKILAPGMHDRDLPHHNDIFIVPSSLYETKPELFALGKDGKRRDPRNRREQPKCYSNPEVRRLYKEAARHYLKSAPHAEYVKLSTCDFHNWCQCSKCRAQDKEGSWTKVYMDMINEVAEEVMPEFPGKKILATAYSYTSEPFKGLKMHPSVVVVYAFYKPYFTSDTVNESYGNRKGWKQVKGWLEIMNKGDIIAFLYPTQFQTRYALTMPFNATCERIEYARKHNFEGIELCGVTSQFEALMTYVWGKMFWNKNVDIQSLVKEHMEFYYGKDAAPYMVEYFNCINRHVKEKKPSQYCEFPIIGSVTPKLLEDLHALLDKALKAVPEQGVARRSLMYHKAVLLFSELDEYNVNNAPVNNDYKRFASRMAEFVNILGEKVSFTDYPHPYRDVSAWFSYVTGIQVKNKKHYLDPEMKKFLANPVVKPKQLEVVSGNTISCKNFTGAQQYPNRPQSRANLCIRRASSLWSRAVARFSGNDVEKITITGMTELDEIPAKIMVNGKVLFNGNIKFDKGANKWGNFHLIVPRGILNEKCNEIVIRNTCPDPEGNAPYTYGWMSVWKVDLKRNK